MTLTSAFIIYFALGVPFGVLAVYLRSGRLLPNDVFRVVYHLALWPIIVVSRGIESSRSIEFEFNKYSDTTRINRSNAENAKRRLANSQKVVLDGLTEVHRSALAAEDLRLPFQDCIEHPNPELAAKCFQLRNIRRLERHIANARKDLAEISNGVQARRWAEDLAETSPDAGVAVSETF